MENYKCCFLSPYIRSENDFKIGDCNISKIINVAVSKS